MPLKGILGSVIHVACATSEIRRICIVRNPFTSKLIITIKGIAKLYPDGQAIAILAIG